MARKPAKSHDIPHENYSSGRKSSRSKAGERLNLPRGNYGPWPVSLCLAVFAVILLLLPVHAFLSTWLGTTIGPLLVWKSWKEILLILLVPVIAVYCIKRPDVAKLVWSRLANKLIAAYAVLHVLLALVSHASHDAVLAGLLMNLRFFAMFVLAQIIVASGHPWVRRLQRLLPVWLLWTTIGLAVFGILQVTVLPKNFLDTFGYSKDTTIAPVTLVDDNPDVLRAFSTMRGPNTLGSYLIIPLAFALYGLLKRQNMWLAGVALSLGLVVLVQTDSRSAWIGTLVMMVALGVLLLPRAALITWAKRLVIPVVLAIVVLAWAALTVPSVRLAIFHSGANRATLTTGSTQNHWLATLGGIKYVTVHPLGTGPGSAGPASFYNTNAQPIISENYYVQIAEETGVLGLLLFIAICILTARALWRARSPTAMLLLASFIGLSVVGVFLHVWADDPTAMTWWGLAGLALSGSHSGSGSASARHQRT
jgi:hypothetical protein